MNHSPANISVWQTEIFGDSCVTGATLFRHFHGSETSWRGGTQRWHQMLGGWEVGNGRLSLGREGSWQAKPNSALKSDLACKEFSSLTATSSFPAIPTPNSAWSAEGLILVETMHVRKLCVTQRFCPENLRVAIHSKHSYNPESSFLLVVGSEALGGLGTLLMESQVDQATGIFALGGRGNGQHYCVPIPWQPFPSGGMIPAAATVVQLLSTVQGEAPLNSWPPCSPHWKKHFCDHQVQVWLLPPLPPNWDHKVICPPPKLATHLML